MSGVRMWLLACLAATMTGLLPGAAAAQIGGVYIDADGVLRSRDAATGRSAAKMQKARKGKNHSPREGEELAYISLPALAAEVQKMQSAGKSIPAEMAFLGGMVKIRYLFVYPNEKDLVLAGTTEELDMSVPDRPVGRSSGRRALRLDDLVVAMRTVGPGQAAGKMVGCSIDLPPDGLSNLMAASKQIGAITGDNNPAVAMRLRNAVGNEDVRLFSIPEDTMAAYTCVEADFILKRLALGLQRSPISAVKSHLSLMRLGDGAYQRWWFVPNYQPLCVGPDGLSFELRGKGLKVRCSSSPTDDEKKAAPSAKKFAEMVSEHFPALAESIPSFGDLWNVTDLVVVSALIRQENLATKTGWDLKWILDPRGYKVAKQPTPRQVEALVNYRATSSVLSTVVGGVTIDPGAAISPGNRTTDGGAELAKLARRPSGSWTSRGSKSD